MSAAVTEAGMNTSSATAPLMALDGVSRFFGNNLALDDVSIDAYPGGKCIACSATMAPVNRR